MEERIKKSKTHTMLGVNPNTERAENDYYATSPEAIETALPILREMGLSENVWECACGEGHISKVLQNNGYNVKSSDLIDRGFGEVHDFLTCKEVWNGDIITNPPFKHALDFAKKRIGTSPRRQKAISFLEDTIFRE